MRLSYAITVCDEFVEIQRLVNFLLEHKRSSDEVVVLYDQKNGNEEIATYLTKLNKLPNFQMWRGFFDGNFGEWKNKLTDYCGGDYIFQLDADELPHPNLIRVLPDILKHNPKNQVFLVSRVNTVKGITEEHIQKWGWNMDTRGWINFPDFQTRIWKKEGNVRWFGKVHERLVNFHTYTNLPAEEIYSLYHHKEIGRQEKQNNFYNKIIK